MSLSSMQRRYTRTRHLTTLGLIACALIAVALALQSCVSANAATVESKPVFTVEWPQVDSARVIAKWTPACDARGCPDAYQVRWAAINATRSVTKTVTVDSFMIKRPAFGDSLMVTTSVNSVRRGVIGSVRTASMWLRNPDAPPPPVDSLKVDTLPSHVDSIRLAVRSASGTSLIAEGDSALMIARFFIAPGHNRQPRDTINGWRIQSITPGSSARISRSWADSAWVVATSCGCAESGRTSEAPALDLSTGSYVVPLKSGRLVPVTPRSADPYRTRALARGNQ